MEQSRTHIKASLDLQRSGGAFFISPPHAPSRAGILVRTNLLNTFRSSLRDEGAGKAISEGNHEMGSWAHAVGSRSAECASESALRLRGRTRLPIQRESDRLLCGSSPHPSTPFGGPARNLLPQADGWGASCGFYSPRRRSFQIQVRGS